MADTEDISIHINDYSLWYGDFQALFNVTVDIRPGIVTSMIGPSGCGKTTPSSCLAGIKHGAKFWLY